METQMLGKLFGKKVFPLTWKMHTVLCVFYSKHLIWMGKCASCQMPKRIGAKRSHSLPCCLSLSFPAEGVQRNTAFSFAVCHLFNTTLAGFGFLSTRTGARFYPTKLMAKSILPEISFCGRPWYEGIYVMLFLLVCGQEGVLSFELTLRLERAMRWSREFSASPGGRLPHTAMAMRV